MTAVPPPAPPPPPRPKCGAPGCTDDVMPGLVPACEFCKKKMCISHQVPFSHGCRDAARNAGKMAATRDAIAQHEARKGLGQEDLRAKLAKKREELAKDRAKKPTKK